MIEESYISGLSKDNEVQQVHLNAAIKSLNQYIDSWSDCKTEQDYAIVDYTGVASNFKPTKHPKSIEYFIGCSSSYEVLVGVLQTNGAYCSCSLSITREFYDTKMVKDTYFICSTPNHDYEIDRKAISITNVNEDGSIVHCTGYCICCAYLQCSWLDCRWYKDYVICCGESKVDLTNAQISIYQKYLTS